MCCFGTYIRSSGRYQFHVGTQALLNGWYAFQNGNAMMLFLEQQSFESEQDRMV
jgi:hypothetical protein